MDDKTKVVKHLEIIQGVINRLGHDSFLIKSWSMAVLVAGIVFIARAEVQSRCIVLVFLIPVIGFWILDGYFLWQERLFRKIYDEVRKKDSTDFAMNPIKHINEPNCKWRNSIFSRTLNIFYGIEVLFVCIVFVILK